jgi:geranylgeranyl diphosphate synthase type I
MKTSATIVPGQSLLDAFEEHLERYVCSFADSSPTYEMVRYHFGYGAEGQRKGKRLRPRILLLVAEEEGAPRELAIDAAVAIELLHNYSLVHDDIEDHDEIRHGRKTLWARYGVAHGINAGDAMCAMSYLALLRCCSDHPPNALTEMARTLHEANLAMCAGQGLDIMFESADAVTFDQYLTMIEGKTAALFSAACEMGALSAGLDQARTRSYRDLGRLYGVAFQIRDDVLGTWGLSTVTGKPSGADIARRKRSFPVVWALAGPPSAAQQRVADAYAQNRILGEGEVGEVIAALDVLGAREAADVAYEQRVEKANVLAESAGVDRRGALRSLFLASMQRIA